MSGSRVLALLALLVGSVHCFSWDIVVGRENALEFYYNGTLTHTEGIPSAYYIQSVTYDPVHYRVLFADNNNLTITISSFDLSTRKIQPLVIRKSAGAYIIRVVFDPVTQVLFWKDGYNDVYSFSLNPAFPNKASDGNVLFNVYPTCSDIAVDSCGGYIYWITDYVIERARLDGSEREVLLDDHVYWRISLAIDQQTQKLYWIDITKTQGSIKCADFNGKNRTTLYIIQKPSLPHSLAVSKDYIYWQDYVQDGIWQLPKNSSQPVSRKLFTVSVPISAYLAVFCRRIAANYTIKEQFQGIKTCEVIQIPNPKHESTVSNCQNYCFQGDCNVNSEGQPKCSCKDGYSGERCEVNACSKYCLNGGASILNEEDEPVCQCIADYDGARCNVSICKDYCWQGNCSVSAEGLPKCSCKAGYSGERCEENVCYKHCLNGGVCFLDEEEKPVCQCTADYDGERCDIPAYLIKCIQTVSNLKDLINTDLLSVALGNGVKSTCAGPVV